MKRILIFILLSLSPLALFQAIATTYTVAGSDNHMPQNWNPADTSCDMTETEGVYVLVRENVTLNAGTTYKYKICEDHAWTTSYGAFGGNDDATFTVSANGTYTVIYVFDKDNSDSTKKVNAYPIMSMEVAGDDEIFGGTEWQMHAMTLASNKLSYTYTVQNIELSSTALNYKFLKDGDWDILNPANRSLTATNHSFYDVEFKYNIHEGTASVTATEVFNSAVVNNVYGLDELIDATMTQSGTTFTYTKQGIVLPKGTFWYNIGVNGISERTFPEGENASISIPARAKYNITFTFDTTTKTVNATYEVAENFNNTVETYFVNKKNWDNVYCYVWLDDKCFTADWPGDQCVKTDLTETVDGVEYEVWKWQYNVESIEDVPDGIIFNDGIAAGDITNDNRNQHQTQDQYFVNKGMFIYYDYNNEDYQHKNSNVYKVTIPDAGSNKNHDFDFYLQSDVIAATLSYDRTFTVGQVSTVCLPFDLTTSEVTTAGGFYQLKSFDPAGAKITFEPVTTTTAYLPYLFVAKTATPFISLNDKTIKESTGLVHKHTVDGVSFVGVLERTNVISNSVTSYYGFGGGKYKKAGTSTGANFNPFRAYLEVPTATAGAKEVYDVDFEEITGIKTMHHEEYIMYNNPSIYDLQGRKVNEDTNDNANSQLSTLKPGIYIINGKKIVIK